MGSIAVATMNRRNDYLLTSTVRASAGQVFVPTRHALGGPQMSAHFAVPTRHGAVSLVIGGVTIFGLGGEGALAFCGGSPQVAAATKQATLASANRTAFMRTPLLLQDRCRSLCYGTPQEYSRPVAQWSKNVQRKLLIIGASDLAAGQVVELPTGWFVCRDDF